MGHILSIHSYRGGTGKSNLSANMAYQAMRRGRRVAVLDTDLQSPGVHMVLGLRPERMANTLSDYLFGRCELEDTVYNLTNDFDAGESGGALYLVPSSMRVDQILRVLEGYDAAKLNDHMGRLIKDLNLDLLIMDTHPGLNRETMMSTAVSDGLLLVVRPDTQDFHGTAVLMEVASQLNVPHVYMMANKVPKSLDMMDVREKMEAAFKVPVLGLVPLAEELAVLGSRGLFTAKHPRHEASLELGRILDRLLAGLEEGQP